MDETTTPKASTPHFLVAASVTLALAVTAIAGGAAVLVFGSYGSGKLLSRWLPFTPYEATMVSLVALVAAGAAGLQLLSRVLVRPDAGADAERCPECGGFHDELELDGAAGGDGEGEEARANSGLRAALYLAGAVTPSAPCPCGSGSRYGKCCGDGRQFRRRRTARRGRFP